MSIEITATCNEYIVKEILKQPERTLDSGELLISSGVIDSFSLVDLALFVEDTFGVIIDDSELNSDTFDSLNELVNIINQRKA